MKHITFKIAKLLKEKGFDQTCQQRYIKCSLDKEIIFQEDCSEYNWNYNYDDSSNTYYSAPTISDIVDWIYEKHGIWIEVSRDYADGKYIYQYFIDIHNQEFGFNTPQEAYLSAIEYTLNNLI